MIFDSVHKPFLKCDHLKLSSCTFFKMLLFQNGAVNILHINFEVFSSFEP